MRRALAFVAVPLVLFGAWLMSRPRAVAGVPEFDDGGLWGGEDFQSWDISAAPTVPVWSPWSQSDQGGPWNDDAAPLVEAGAFSEAPVQDMGESEIFALADKGENVMGDYADPDQVLGGGNFERIKSELARERGPVENVEAFEPFVIEAAGTFGVRPEIIRAMIFRESRYKPDARNPTSSATGLMQVLRGTAADMGFAGQDLTDPRTAIMCGTKYLGIQIASFGEVDGVRAYYAGPGNIRKEKKYGVGSIVTAEADRYAEGVFANV